MFDTNIVVVGNVLAAPEWRRFDNSGSVVANFRVASTARRFDRASNSWVDGNSLRIRVTAWRRLAEGVISSICVGDPVIVYGRVYTRDWKDDQGNPRISYEMDASAIGHDLARGQGRFTRNRPMAAAGAGVHDSEEELFAAASLPVPFGDGGPEDAPTFAEVTASADAPGPEASELPEAAADAPEPEVSVSAEGEASADVPEAAPSDEEIALEVERLTAEQPAPARRTRRTRKDPVAV